jgi:aspartokinase-like uncharacterized kinase
MATAAHQDFVVDALDLDGIAVSRDEGQLVAARDLSDDQTSLEDVLDLAHDHGLYPENMAVDIPDGEARVYLAGGAP